MKCILVLAAQFQIWDAIITYVFVNNGIVREANPLMAPVVSSGINFLLIKAFSALVFVPILWIMYKHLPRVSIAAASSLVVFYAFVITWNFYVCFNML